MKKILCILLAVLFIVSVAVSCTDNKTDEQTAANTSEVPTTPEENSTPVESTSVPVESTSEAESTAAFTENIESTSTEAPITETIAEPEPTETIAEPNPNEALLGTFICTGKTFADDSFQNAPEYIPLLTLNSDGTIIWRVYYIGGVVDLGGTYVVEDNKVCIYPELAGPVLGYDVGGFPYMDDYFELDIADENTLVMRRVEENHFKGACYAVKVGDAFVRE